MKSEIRKQIINMYLETLMLLGCRPHIVFEKSQLYQQTASKWTKEERKAHKERHLDSLQIPGIRALIVGKSPAWRSPRSK